MNRTELVAGLDIGTTKVCMVIAEVQPGGQLEIVGEGLEPSTGMHRGVVVDIDATARAIIKAADKAQRVAGVQISSAFVGVSGEHIASVNSKGIIAITQPQRVIRQEDVERAIDSSRVVVLPPDREIIHAIPRGFSIDGQDGIKSPVGMNGSRLGVETHIVHGITSFLQNLAQCVDKAGFKVESFVLQSFAAAKAVLGDSERGLGVGLVDIGGGTTDIAIYNDDNIVHSAVLGVGGNHVTQDIAVGLQCSISEAERVKIKIGTVDESQIADGETFSFKRIGSEQPTTLPRQLLLEIIEPRMSEIFQLVDDVITKSNSKGKMPAGLVFTGGTSLLSGAIGLAEKTLDMPSRMGRLSSVGGIRDAVSDPQHATAVGLTIFGSEQVNLNGYVKNRGVSSLLSKLKDALMRSD